ncbi:hypothetical protein M9458_014783, partial [Cirrhinus mrigala]
MSVPLFSFAHKEAETAAGEQDEQDLWIVNGGNVEAQQTPDDTETMDGQKGVKVEVENSQPEEEDEDGDGDEMFRPLHFP